MNIEHLREFEYLAENLSFRDTARHFFVSPSVISRHISAMEDELGTKLFVRSKQSVAITEAGTVFLDRSKAILSEYNAALAEMSRLDEGGKPVVRLGYLHNAARPFILQFTSYLKEHYPEIEIEFKGMPYKMLYTALDDNRADLNIMLNVYSPHQQRYELATMYRDQFCAVVRANSRLARDCADGIELSRLVGLDLLLPRFPGSAGADAEGARNRALPSDGARSQLPRRRLDVHPGGNVEQRRHFHKRELGIRVEQGGVSPHQRRRCRHRRERLHRPLAFGPHAHSVQGGACELSGLS